MHYCNNERGQSFSTAMAATALISAMMATLYIVCGSVFQLASDYKLASRNIQSLFAPTSSIDARSSQCTLLRDSTIRICVAASRAYRSAPLLPFTELTRAFDFVPLASNFNRCSSAISIPILSHAKLPTSPSLCTVKVLERAELRLREALSSEIIIATQPLSQKPSVFYTQGDLVVSKEFRLANDVLIVSLGNVYIKHLAAIGTATRRATIISIGGDVVIGTRNSFVFPLVFARGAIQVPAAPLNAPYPILAESNPAAIIGIDRP